MKHIISFVLPVLAFLVIGCTSDDIDVGTETESQSTGFISVGNPIEVTLNLTTLPFDVDVSTRTEDPREYDPSYSTELAAIENENNILTVWIFEFDAKDGTLVSDPFYATYPNSNNDSERDGLKYWRVSNVPLSDNNGEPVIIYAITNADGGSDSNAEKNWVSYDEETGTYPGFMSIKELEAQTLPTTYQYMTTCKNSTTWPLFYLSSVHSKTFIPMSGYTEELTLTSSQTISVDVTSMYARIMVYASTDNPDVFIETGGALEWYYNIVIENIPCYCRVAPLGTAETITAYDYTSISNLQWTYFSLATVGNNGFEFTVETDDTSKDTRLIAYVPENIQGEVSSYDSEKMRAENTPRTQYSLGTKSYNELSYPDYGLNGVAGVTDAMAVHFYQRAENVAWTIFPGGNNTDNFNVRRNCTYRIIFNLVEKQAEDVDVDLTITNGENESFFTNDDSFSYKYRK